MRITDATRHREVLANLANTSRALDRAQSQISTGLRVRRASDDPGAALAVLKLDGAARGLTQNQRSIGSALSRMESEESVLGQLGDALSRARELAVGQGDDAANAATRAQTKVEVDKLLEFAVQLGNTRGVDGYLFGGFNPETRPFDPVTPLTTTVAAGEQQRVEISPGQQADTSHNAREVFLDTGAFAALKEFSTALGANDADGIRKALGSLVASYDAVQGVTGDLGGRVNQLEMTHTRLRAQELATTTRRSELRDADAESSYVELVTRQNALQSAMLATSRVLGLTLSDYLR